MLGLASSTLQGMNSLVESGMVAMVMLSSTRILDHWLVVMVVILRQLLSFTFLIVVKKSLE